MFLIEAGIFLLFVGGFCGWFLLADRVTDWRDRREGERISSALNALEGDAIEHVLDRFGPPREHYEGSTGRSLYVWRRPPSAGLPPSRRLLVVTLTVDSGGRVVESAWQRR